MRTARKVSATLPNLDKFHRCIIMIQMVDPIPVRRPINWARLPNDQAERLIRERAADTSKIRFSLHAYDRIAERSITQIDAIRILRTGHIEGNPQKTVEGEWEVTVVKRILGTREVGVVTIIWRNKDELFVKIVEWMDFTR